MIVKIKYFFSWLRLTICISSGWVKIRVNQYKVRQYSQKFDYEFFYWEEIEIDEVDEIILLLVIN